jgi:hypothetical protein
MKRKKRQGVEITWLKEKIKNVEWTSNGSIGKKFSDENEGS